MTRSKPDGMARGSVRGPHRPGLPAVLLGLAAAALGCSSGGDEVDSAASTATRGDSADATVVSVESPDERTSSSAAGTSTAPPTTRAPIEDGPLSEVCPERIVVQTSGLPAPEVGPLFELLGPEATFDLASASASGPLVRVDGTLEDVTLEIRAGGPPVGFRAPIALLQDDPEILLAQTSIADAVRKSSASPSVGVVALTDRSRDVIIVDPATYPGVETVAAIRDAGIEVRHMTGAAFIAYLAGTGALTPEQLVPGFDGEPAAFVQSNGAIGQQGDQLVDPVLIPSLQQWARPVVSVDVSTAGWDDSGDALAVRPQAVENRRECLGRLVPVVQEAIVAYASSPQTTNSRMSDFRAQLTPLARLTPELMNAGTALGVETGVFEGGSDPVVGDFDLERLDPFLAEFAGVVGVEAVATEGRVTNEFIDPSVTSAS